MLLVFACLSGTLLSAQNLSDPIADSLQAEINRHLDKGSLDSALMINAEMIRYMERIGDDYNFVRHHVNRAEVIRMMGGLAEAQRILEDVEDLNQSLPLSTVRSTFYNRKAAILHESKQFDKALIAVKESQRIDSIQNYKWRLFSNLIIEGAIYRDQKQFEKAFKTMQKVKVLALEVKDSTELASAYYNLTILAYRLDDQKAVIHNGRQFMRYATSVNRNVSYGDMLHFVARAYEQLGQYDSAFFFGDSAYGIRMQHMQIMLKENNRKAEIMNDLEKERLQNERLSIERDQNRLQIFVLFLAVAIAVLLIYFANRQRVQYKKLNEQQEQYNRELEESLDFKNKLISIVAHDIRNPLASLRGLIGVYNQGLVEEGEIKPMMKGLEASVVNVDLLLENLLNWVRTQSESLEPQIEEIDLVQLAKNAEEEGQAQISAKAIQLEFENLTERIPLKSDPNYISFALRNVLSNAIKYSEKEGRIILRFQRKEEGYCLEVQDFGKGMNSETLAKLRAKLNTRSILGTGKERGTGLGLSMSASFLSLIGGRLEFESELGEGTVVRLCIPHSFENQ